MKFNYQARTKEGEIRVGHIEASSKSTAADLLQKNGLYVTFLEEASPPIYAKKVKIFQAISRQEIVVFSRLLAVMFTAKVPLMEALRVLSSQTKNSDFKEKITEISEEVESGTAFSLVLSRNPKIFSPFYIAMVKSGEISGKLSEVLNYLAGHLEKEYRLNSKIKGALVYPAVIFCVIFAVMGIMIYYVIPQLASVLEGSAGELPFMTKAVIGFAAFVRQWGWLLMAGLIFSFFVAARYYFTEKGRKFFDKIFIKTPIIGPFLKMFYLARFAENLSTLIAGGLPIAQALDTTGDIVSNATYKKIIFEARDGVRKGEPISSVLSRYPDFFSPVFVQMVIVGEKTGTMDTTLMNIVNFYQEEIDRAIDGILNVLEPILIVFLGLAVAGVMLSILMPLYNMISL